MRLAWCTGYHLLLGDVGSDKRMFPIIRGMVCREQRRKQRASRYINRRRDADQLLLYQSCIANVSSLEMLLS